MPGILTDAISLCKDMGERYLWVDRLCIVQDDLTSKMKQIQAMDSIYLSAAFTIAAALNSNDGTGLSGYKNRPRYPNSSGPEQVHYLNNLSRGFYTNPSDENISSSLWNTRGWTFQERLLSRRTIFITEHEVRFECQETRASEMETWSYNDMELVPQPNYLTSLGCSPEEGENILQLNREEEEVTWTHGYVSSQYLTLETDLSRKEPPTLKHYCRWVEDYTRRELSFPSDILNAFAGAAKIVSSSLGSRMLFGLPERYLPQALMWGPTASKPRDACAHPRTCGTSIPSWSWAHRKQPVQYHGIDFLGAIDDHRKTASMVACFYYHDPENSGRGLRKLDVEQRWLDQHVDMTDLKGVANLLHAAMPSTWVDWLNSDGWEQCPHSPWEAIAHHGLATNDYEIATTLPGCLVFNTTVASADQRLHMASENLGDDFRGTISDSQGEILGSWADLLSDQEPLRSPQAMESERRAVFDFIVVCASVKTHWMRYGRCSVPPDVCWWLHVMLVERVSTRPYIARRVGVGEIRINRWKDCNPRWETVILC